MPCKTVLFHFSEIFLECSFISCFQDSTPSRPPPPSQTHHPHIPQKHHIRVIRLVLPQMYFRFCVPPVWRGWGPLETYLRCRFVEGIFISEIEIAGNLRELGHTNLVKKVSWSRTQIGQKGQLVKRSLGPKSQILNPRSQIPNPKSSIPSPRSQIPNPKTCKVWLRL